MDGLFEDPALAAALFFEEILPATEQDDEEDEEEDADWWQQPNPADPLWRRCGCPVDEPCQGHPDD